MYPNLLRLWSGPLPHQELFPQQPVNPLIHWLYHPLKRWLSKFYIAFLQKNFGLRVIAVTGSTGKTTAKDMLYSVLIKISPAVITSDAGNPTYSIPAAILHCRTSTRFLILEMGAKYPGDMLFYTWLVKPDISILTDIGYTHTEFFGTLARLVAEETGLITLTPQNITNADDPNITVSFPTYKFGVSPDNYTQILSSQITPQLTTEISLKVSGQEVKTELPALGTHFVYPAAAAATAASLVDVHPQIIAHGLKTFSLSPHCLSPVAVSQNVLLLDDTSNAHPQATLASLNVLHQVARLTHATPVFVFGQMDELGQYEASAHQQIGLEIKRLGIVHLYCLGPATRFTIKSAGYGQYFDHQSDLLSALQKLLPADSKLCLLIKGSPSWHLDKLVASLLANRH